MATHRKEETPGHETPGVNQELMEQLRERDRHIQKLEAIRDKTPHECEWRRRRCEDELDTMRRNRESFLDVMDPDSMTTLSAIRKSRAEERLLRARMNLADVQKRCVGDDSWDARALIEGARREVELAALPEDEAISRRDSGARIGSIKRPGGEVRWSFLPEEKLITLDLDYSVSPSLEILSEVEHSIPLAVGKCLGEIWPGLEVKLKARLTAVLYPNPFVIKDKQERPVTVLLFSLQKHRFEESSWNEIDRVLAIFHK